jgi:hypothetical protein
MRSEQIRHLLVDLANLLLEELQFLRRHLQQPPIEQAIEPAALML